MRLAAHVAGIGILGPGLADWAASTATLAGRQAYASAPTLLPAPLLLPSAERRRAGRVVKLALAVAHQATTHAGVDPATLASVFTSSGGDGYNCHELCEALAEDSREVSPTRFANSVHNAAAGYWSIATAATRESTVLCAFDASFGAGLIEAMTQVTVERHALLLVAYDTEYPEPIRAKRPVPDAFGMALVLTPETGPTSVARLELTLTRTLPDGMALEPLEALRTTIPAARSLPLLQRLALREAGTTVIEYLDEIRLSVRVEPCA